MLGEASNSLGAQIWKLLETNELPDIGPAVRSGVLSEREVAGRLSALISSGHLPRHWKEIEGLLYFWHDQMERAHSISQDIKSPEGAILHGMVHRREPDFPNAKYWFNRAKGHAFLDLVADETRGIFERGSGADRRERLMPNGRWNPISFVDFCEEVIGSKARGQVKVFARELQAAEVRAFLKWMLGA